jgi:four helix bundle protein
MAGEASGFENLEVWKEARAFRIMITELCKTFPQEERFRLADQIKRSSRSVTANISEGYGRFHYIDNIKFCRDARGSLNETLDHLTVSLDEKYINDQQFYIYKIKYEKVLRLLNGYIAYLKR